VRTTRPAPALALLALAVAALAACAGAGAGARHESLDALVQAEKNDGWVMVGHFGDDWPARVVGRDVADDAISFTLADGVEHEYRGFEGYRLQVVRLEGARGTEVVVLFRSTERR